MSERGRYNPGHVQMKEYVCPDCKRTFESDAPRVKYCPTCRALRWPQKNELVHKKCRYEPCGEEFDTNIPWQDFCCTEHRQSFWREHYAKIREQELSKILSVKE